MTSHVDRFSLFDLSFFDPATHVAVIQAYFDGSEGHKGYYAVGGYVFEKRSVRPFERLWRRMLKTYSLPHFHMTDCNSRQDVYEHWDKQMAEDFQKEAFRIIELHAKYGVFSAIKVSDFAQNPIISRFMKSPFSLCSYSILLQCGEISKDHGDNSKYSYIFEDGDDFQADVGTILKSISKNEEMRERYRYSSHGFLPKEQSLPAQAADILAWHATKQLSRPNEGKPLRTDFRILMEKIPTYGFVWTKEKIDKVFQSEKIANLAGLQMRGAKINSEIIGREILAILENR